nr:DUF3693 domain-containing protein [Stenotrophomonas geniculata]
MYMDAVNQLLDQARVGTNLPSDNALAQRMGVTRAVVSNWRQARNPIPDERIAQLCAMAKLDGPAWTARIHAERAASPAERAMWKSMLDRLSAVAAVLALVVFAAPGAARAKAIDSQGFSGSDQPHSVYYVKSIPEDAGVPLASMTGLAMPSQEKPASPACPSRPGSYGFLHRPIRVLCMTQAIQPQTKPPPATMISSSSKAAPFSP